MKRIVIVGGVAGGMSAATRLRRLDNDAQIVVLERSGHVSYANCGLPYYVGGVIENEKDLLLQTPESLHARFRLDVRVLTLVVSIDRARNTVLVRNLVTGKDYELEYDKLILSPGATPIVPAIPGVERAMTLRTVEDVEKIAARVADKPATAVVIGAGFIGVEIAENLATRNIKVTIVEAEDQPLAPLDPEMASLVSAELIRNGVGLCLGCKVAEITSNSVILENGVEVPADLVIIAIGVRPDISLAKGAGLVIGPRNGIQVDTFNRTSEVDIYAIGDGAEKIDALDGSATLVPLANLANRHGRTVADHIAGREVRDVPSIGTSIVKVFDLMIASTGWSEKRLKQQDRAHLCIHTHPNSHAVYYPGAKQMSLKLIFDPLTGLILGAQGVGIAGIDKRIDVIATAIRGGLTAPELADLELAYAPPYGSAKDAVNMLGYIAENMLSGLIQTIQWHEVDSYLNRDFALVDVRDPNEFAAGNIPGSINISLNEIRERRSEIPSKKVVVYCQVGQRGHTAALLLNELGVSALNLDGGYLTWSKSPVREKVLSNRKLIAHFKHTRKGISEYVQ